MGKPKSNSVGSALSENQLVAECTRENLEIGLHAQKPQWTSAYTAKDQRSKWKSTSSGVYAWKTSKLDYARKNPQWKLDNTAKDQRSKWKSTSSGMYAWKPSKFDYNAQKTPVNVGLHSKSYK